MSKRLQVLVLLDTKDEAAEEFRKAIASETSLSESIELSFATNQDAVNVIEDVEVVSCGNLSSKLLDQAANLKWIAYWSAGLDGKITDQIKQKNLNITNASGVHGPNIAEHVFAWMLLFTRRMDVHLRSQLTHEWDRKMPLDKGPAAAELCGQTLGIIGMGRIGEALACSAHAFGMRVIGIKRDATHRHQSMDDLKLNEVEVYGIDQLPDVLAQSDHVCICLPHTTKTHHIFDGAMIANMKPTGYLYNIARGSIIDEAALCEALSSGTIAGAGLDVFEQEPLPAQSPLWDLPNVMITPHVAGITPYYFQRYAKLFAQNLKRYIAGEKLHNLYDDARGY